MRDVRCQRIARGLGCGWIGCGGTARLQQPSSSVHERTGAAPRRRRPWQSCTLGVVCCASARSVPAGGRPRRGRPLRASYVPALAVLHHPTSSLSPCAPAHARRRRRRPGWSTWPRSASRPTNQRRSAVRCARAFRTLDFYCNRNAHSRPGPNMARPLVSCDGSPRGVPFSGAIVPSLSLSLSRSLSFADCFARGIMELSSSELDTGWSSLDQLVYELPDELISRLNGLAAAAGGRGGGGGGRR